MKFSKTVGSAYNDGLIQKLYGEHISILRQAHLNDNLAIFIGAGISKLTNKKYPLWGEVIEKLKRGLDNTAETDPLKIAQLYELEYSPYQTKKTLRDIFPKVDKPGPIQKLLFTINPHYIITTNWDTLLEKEVDENALNYDVVCSDSELVESCLKNKLIKMHGDFLHDNYVFTEYDYINYSNSFPLTENYIKSIISTHTILFMGYSFSDIDLKHIFNWLKRNSNDRPPAYLAINPGRYKKTEEKYLKNFDITVLQMQKDDKEDRSYEYCLLNAINANNQVDNHDPIEYVLSILEPLDSLLAILRPQIMDRLTNCTFVYDKYSRAVLQFTWDIVTKDKNENKLKIYRNFVDEVLLEGSETEKNNLMRIFSILKKADIHGIMTTSLLNDKQEYCNFDETHSVQYNIDSKGFDFYFTTVSTTYGDDDNIDSLFEYGFALYNLQDYEKSFFQTKLLIKTLKKNKEYKLLFLALFNYNALLDNLKYGPPRTSKYNDDEVDLDEEFRKFPKREQNEIYQILEFCKFVYLYKNAFFVREDLTKIEKQIRIVESGGISFSADANRYPAEHKNLIDFVLCNKIMIEQYIQYKNINKAYVEIALKRQSLNSTITLNKYEIFTCIKYFSNEDLKLLFESFFFDDKKERRLEHSEMDIDWQVNKVLVNCVNCYINKVYSTSSFEQYIINNVYLLSFIKLSTQDINKILELFNKLINDARNTMFIFESMNIFFGRQYNFYKTFFDVSKVIGLIEILLEKYIYGQCNLYEHETIAHNKIYNLFPYIDLLGGKFSNINIIERLLMNLTDLKEDIRDLTYIAQNFLIPLYQISNEQCKAKICEYLNGFSEKENKDTEGALSFSLSLLQIGLKNNFNEIANELEIFLKKQKDKKTVSSRVFGIKNQVKAIINEHSEFKNSLGLLDELIEWYNSNKMTSYV